MAAFNIRFKPGDHFPIVRRQHFTFTEIFAFTGGLMGLFLGISVVSFAEVVNILLHPIFEKFSSKFCCQKRPTSNRQNQNNFLKTIVKFRSYFSFYLKESSIHSFNFMADAGNYFETIFWFLTFSVSMTGCTFMILQLYRTMNFKAVTLIIDDQLMDVSEISFPAVTIFGRFPNVVKMRFPDFVSYDEYDLTAWIGDYDYEITPIEKSGNVVAKYLP